MAETQTITGVIKKVTKFEGRDTGVTLEGRDGYLNYSQPQYRSEPWEDHGEGDTVKLAVQESNGKVYIKAIKVEAKAEQSGVHEALPTTYWGPKRRLDALTLAQAALALVPGVDYGTPENFAQTVVSVADIYVAFIEGSGGQDG